MTLEVVSTIADFCLFIFLFILIFAFASWLLYTPKKQLFSTESGTISQSLEFAQAPTSNKENLFTLLACLLEDAPATSLKGQSYQLAIPLMTPLACLLEDIPSVSLQGQFYTLASPLACIVTQAWQAFYKENLAKPGIDYWQWQDKPEVNNVCPELSLLLKLPKPKRYVQEILATLATGIDPFLAIASYERHNQEFDSNLGKSNQTPILNQDKNHGGVCWTQLEPKIQKEMLQAFKKWHDRAWELIGQVALTSVYQVCYGVSWQTVENLLNPIDLIYIKTTQPWWQVLGVKKSAKSFQVETAYKRLIRIWHPDLNKSPYATEVTSRLNVAYQEYRLLQKKTTHKRDIKLDSQLFIRLQSFFKPLFSR